MVADESPLHRLGRAARPGEARDYDRPGAGARCLGRLRSGDRGATKAISRSGGHEDRRIPALEAPSAEVHRLYPQDDEGKEDA